MNIKVIHGVQFNMNAVKSISLLRFKELYEVRFGGNTDSIYYEITGKVKKEKKPKNKLNEEAPN